MKENVSLLIRMVRFNYVGLPRSGKTSFRRRLAGEILNILKAIESGETVQQPSTGVAESGGQVIIGSRLDTSFGVIRSRVWSVFKNLKEEAGMLTQFIHQTVFSCSEANSACSTKETACEVSLPESYSPTLEMEVDSDPLPLLTASRPTPARVASDQSTRADRVVNSQEEMDISSNDDTIEDMFTIIGEAIKAKDWNKVKYILDDTIILTSTDTGGQAEFMDLHASLVHGPSFNLLFYRLVDELDSEFKVCYTDKNSRSTTEQDSTFTVEEVLFQALSSIACCSGTFKICDEDASEKTDTILPGHSKSTVMFVGTYRDMVDDEQFEQKDKNLKEAIEHTAFYDKGIIKSAADGQLILPVDNLKGKQDEIDTIRDRLVEVIENSFRKIPIPASWLVLSLHIRSKKLRTMTLSECERMASNVGIHPNDLKEVLWFLHHHMGVLLYYPELEELESTVICDIQVVFDSATKLIKNTFTFDNQVTDFVRDNFKTKGQFTLMDVKQAMSGHTDALLPLDKLLQLLEHLNVLTKIPSTDDGPKYFMPCVLKLAKPDELTIPDLKEDTDPAPLLLHYKCGYMPAGLFPALLANLISQQREDWEMITDGLFKNRVEFLVGEDFDTVILISHPRYFEIAIIRVEDFQTPSDLLCAIVLDVIQSTLRTVTSRMNNFNMECMYLFRCPCHCEKKHLCEVPKPTARRMLCLHNPNRKRPIALKPCHKVWFTRETNHSEGMFVVSTGTILS